MLRRPCFLPIKCMKTATWSHTVNSEDFLGAEASDVLEMRLSDPSANLASISSAKRLKVRDNVKRIDTIFTEILKEFSDLTQELRRTDDDFPPASGASWAPQVDFLALVEHRLIPARVRSEWPRLREKGLATIWALASKESSHVGNASVLALL